MNTKKCKVILLPAENTRKGNFVVLQDNKIKYKRFNQVTPWEKCQNLYFITEDKIEIGDYFYHQICKKVFKANYTDIQNFARITNYKFNKSDFFTTAKPYWNKVISSTDSNLNLPTIPQQWIKESYIPSQGKIMDIELKLYLTEAPPKPKLYTKDNNEVYIVEELINKLSFEQLAYNLYRSTSASGEGHSYKTKIDASTKIYDSFVNPDAPIFDEDPIYQSSIMTTLNEDGSYKHPEFYKNENQIETVEEAAKGYSANAKGTNYPLHSDYDLVKYERKAFKAGANWQKQHSFTKEDLEFAFKAGENNKKVENVSFERMPNATRLSFIQTFAKWFENFQKEKLFK